MSDKTLADLRPGEFVAWVDRHRRSKCRVERVTKTRIVIGNGTAFNRATGNKCGPRDPWYHVRIEPWTDAHSREANAQRKMRRLLDFPWGRVDEETHDRVLEIAEAALAANQVDRSGE